MCFQGSNFKLGIIGLNNGLQPIQRQVEIIWTNDGLFVSNQLKRNFFVHQTPEIAITVSLTKDLRISDIPGPTNH